MAIKIDIISGFLGAGKTTLIKKLLKENLFSERLVLIENEFGEISIDSGILKDSGIEIKEMNSGCICCSLVGDFTIALKEVLKRFSPDRVIIEPSGVGKLSGVIDACKKISVQTDARINMCVVVVDAVKYKMYMNNFSEFYKDQIVNAKTVVLSRTQFLDEHRLSEVVTDIQHQNIKANLVTTEWDKLTGETLVSVAEQDAQSSIAGRLKLKVKTNSPDLNNHNIENQYSHSQKSAGEPTRHQATAVFESWGAETPKSFSKVDIQNILKLINNKRYGHVLRAKGIVPAKQDSWLQFDFVHGEIDIRSITPDYTGRICVIGESLNKAELAKLFNF